VPNQIDFPEADPTYVFERDCLAFPAVVDGKPVLCLITGELLLFRFGAQDMSEEAMRETFQEHRTELQAIARSHIENGWIDDEGRILLTTRFTRLNVTFGETLGKRSALLSAANTAHRLLTEIIGPNAEEVSIVWDVRGSDPEESAISLQIIDPAIPHSAKVFLEHPERQHPEEFRVNLARLWNSILRARSRTLIFKSG
jgi:hypothetical protein